jgi:hypothetical protein
MTSKEALERGDFAQARKLARGTPDEKDIFERTGPDPLILKIAVACVAFYALVILLTHGS